MDLTDIKICREVAVQGSMTQAAEALGYAQSSITARIRKLEAELQVRLFYRNANGVRPTPAGQLLIEQGLKITQMAEDLTCRLRSREVTGGLLRIGSMETTAAIHLPSLLKTYHSLYKQVELLLQTGTTEYLVNQVLKYELDLAFVAAPVNHPDIIEIEAFREEMVLVAEGGQSRQPLADILNSRAILVFRTGCSYRSLLESYLLNYKAIPLKRFEFGSLEAIIAGVASGMGISLLPRSVVEAKLPANDLAVYELPPQLRYCPTLLIKRKDAVQTSAIGQFIQLVSQQAGRHSQAASK